MREWRQWVDNMSTTSNAQFILFVQFTNRDMAVALALSQLQVEDRHEIAAFEDPDYLQTGEVGGVESGSEVGVDYTDGQADGGEIREGLVRTMEMEDQAALLEGAEIEADVQGGGDAEDGGSTEEEDESSDPLPAAWNPEVRGGMSV